MGPVTFAPPSDERPHAEGGAPVGAGAGSTLDIHLILMYRFLM
jgi:hypothetical protein